MGTMVIWFLLAAGGLIWLAALFYILKGWPKKVEGGGSKVEGKETPPAAVLQSPPASIRPPMSRETDEIEIPIPEYPRPESKQEESKPFDKDAFYREFGKSNIVEFPAECIDKESVKSVTGERISMVEFAMSCYRQIGFRCSPSLIPAAEELGGGQDKHI